MLIKITRQGVPLWLNTINITQAYRDDHQGEPRLVIYFAHTNPNSILHLKGDEAIAAANALTEVCASSVWKE